MALPMTPFDPALFKSDVTIRSELTATLEALPRVDGVGFRSEIKLQVSEDKYTVSRLFYECVLGDRHAVCPDAERR